LTRRRTAEKKKKIKTINKNQIVMKAEIREVKELVKTIFEKSKEQHTRDMAYATLLKIHNLEKHNSK
jgi:hypothetical protein